jgi:hypothetical protein
MASVRCRRAWNDHVTAKPRGSGTQARSPAGAGGFDPGKAVACDTYCREFIGMCRDEPTNTYTDIPDCKAKCAQFAQGKDANAETLECRQKQLEYLKATTYANQYCGPASEHPTSACVNFP